MSTVRNQPAQQEPPVNQHSANVPALAGPRLPYHPAIEERFGVDRAAWKALVEAIFPGAQSTESVILALSYCKARNLDPFKRNVHIVPIWDKAKGKLVDTVWPGIGELRTTAFRTGVYAGRDATVFGEDITNTWPVNGKEMALTFPMWAQVTVYRMVKGNRVAFQGPRVYWMETFSSNKGGEPNSMWQKRTRGQLDKCAEASALRAAFPEEIGDDYIDSEAGMIVQHGAGPQQGVSAEQPQTARPQRVDFVNKDEPTEIVTGEDTPHDAATGEITDDSSTAHTPDAPQSDLAQSEPQEQQTSDEPSSDAAPAAGKDDDDALALFDRALAGVNAMGAHKDIVAKNQAWLDALDGLDLADANNVIAKHKSRILSGGRR